MSAGGRNESEWNFEPLNAEKRGAWLLAFIVKQKGLDLIKTCVLIICMIFCVLSLFLLGVLAIR